MQQAQAFASAAAAKGLLLSPADIDALRNEGITTPAGMTSLNDADLASAGVDVAACRANHTRREAQKRERELERIRKAQEAQQAAESAAIAYNHGAC